MCGLGVGPKRVNRIIGVAKAFTTRVGRGPFPTELEGDLALRYARNRSKIRWDPVWHDHQDGFKNELDGWIWLSCIMPGAPTVLLDLVVTKLDILSGIEELPVLHSLCI